MTTIQDRATKFYEIICVLYTHSHANEKTEAAAAQGNDDDDYELQSGIKPMI